MSDSDYLKCSCSHCQGHLEFPAHALGITTTCPHCGVETKLVAPTGTSAPHPPPPPEPDEPPSAPAPALATITRVDVSSGGSKLIKVLSIVSSVVAGLVVFGLVGLKAWKYFRRAGDAVEAVNVEPKAEASQPASEVPKLAPMPAPVAPATSVILVKGTPPTRKPGQDLQVLSFEVQKAKDGNLQYIVGIVTNHAAKQYFNVKLEFDLTRKDGKAGGLATDTIRNLAPNAGVTFKASVIGNPVVATAKLSKLEGEKE